MSAIEIKNLVKKYGDNLAVNDLNLTMEKGKVYGFLGPNGAGKSTTMNIITGYIGATSGSVKVNGFDIFRESDEAKKSFGYLPEIPPLYPEMTVYEYLKFVAEIKKIKKKERLEAINESMELARITQVSGRLIKNLSKGYKQRVGIAQAVMGMPEIIILDEPTVGLDPKQIIEIRQLIKKLGEEHTVILSSHILTEISEVCEHIFIISQGKLVASGNEEELIQNLAGETKIVAEIKTNKTDLEEVLAQVEEIKEYESKEINEEIIKVSIITERETDIREKLFYILASKQMPVLSMALHKKTLEDIFIELTSEYVAPDKKKKKIKEREKTDDMVLSEEIENDNLISKTEEQEDVDISGKDEMYDDVTNVEGEVNIEEVVNVFNKTDSKQEVENNDSNL